MQIMQTGQTARRKETCIKFIKYAECRLWTNIYEIYWYSSVWCLELYVINTFAKST